MDSREVLYEISTKLGHDLDQIVNWLKHHRHGVDVDISQLPPGTVEHEDDVRLRLLSGLEDRIAERAEELTGEEQVAMLRFAAFINGRYTGFPKGEVQSCS